MLNSINSFSKDFKKLFKIKFNNFLKTFPLFISYYIVDSYIEIKKESDKENVLLRYKFDFSKDVKTNIYNIRQKLLQHCPVMKQIELRKEDFSDKELNNLLYNGTIDIYDIDDKKLIKQEVFWRIEKVIPIRDRCLIRNLFTNILHNYNFVKMPCIVFLKDLLQGKYSEEESANIFFEKTILYNIIKEK